LISRRTADIDRQQEKSAENPAGKNGQNREEIMRQTLRTLVMSGALLASIASVQAKELIFGSWAIPNHGVNVYGLAPLFKELDQKTGGALNWKLVSGGQLANPRTTLPSIRDSVIDAGMVLTSVYVKELAASNVVYNLLGFGSDPLAIAGATIETLMLNCPQCLDEYKKMNAVFLAGYGVTPYRLLCAKQISGPDDIKGEKVKIAGGAEARLIKAIGGTPVNLSPSDSIPALQRGALACVHGPYPWLRVYGLDVIRSAIDAPLGTPRGFGMMVANRNTWTSLTAAERKTLWGALPRATALATYKGHVADDQVALDQGKQHGLKVVAAGNKYDPVLTAFNASDQAVVVEESKKLGVRDPETIVKTHLELLKKWDGLVAGIGGDVEKFTALLQAEIYSKINPETW
jgi:TRAP-type C4-dicarboxylate transport system substrate-binding protein